MERKTFKQNWNEVDDTCPYCGQVTKVNRGLTKQNIKKLFEKPSIQDWIIFIMLILALFAALTYQNEIGYYKEIVENPRDLCFSYNQGIFQSYYDEIINVSNIYNIKDNG